MKNKSSRREEELRQLVTIESQNLKNFETAFNQTFKILDYLDVKREATWLIGQIIRKSDSFIEVIYDGYDHTQNDVD